MDEILRNKFANRKFFVRVFIRGNKIIIWNDVDIKYEIELEKVKEIIDSEIDLFVDLIIEKIKKKIEKKYKKKDDKLISVVIPNYNNNIFIEKTIESILNNTYKNVEIIFVDDNSTDGTYDIVVNKYENNDKVKIYKNKENRGAYYCRNKGILLSSGYYVTIVDGDDFIDKEKLEYEYNNLRAKNLEGHKYWAFGTRFQRLYIKNNDIDLVTHINQSNSFVYFFERRLFNYIGYFQDNRFGADSEYIKRAKLFGYDFVVDKSRVFYNAYTISGKNLTQVHLAEERRKYIGDCTNILKKRLYIRMALLDSDDFFILLNL